MQRADKSGAAYVYRVEVVYTCPREEVATQEGRLWNTTYTRVRQIGPLPVMTIQIVGADPNQPGNSLITVTYGRDLSYDPSTFQVGKASISLATRVIERPLTEGPGEKGLFIETAPDKDGLSWRIVGGANTSPHVDAMISVRTAYPPAAINWPGIIMRLGHVNDHDMKAMMSVQKHQVMLIHGNVPSGFRFGDSQTPIPIEYVFWYKATGWLGRTIVQRYVHLPIRRPVLHEDTLEDKELLYVSETGEIATTSTHLAQKRELTGSYAFGDAIPVGSSSEDAFKTNESGPTNPWANTGDPRVIPEPVSTVSFKDILKLIEDGQFGSKK